MDRKYTVSIGIGLVQAPLAIVDARNGRIVEVNEGCARLFKRSSKSDLVGLSMHELLEMEQDLLTASAKVNMDLAFRVARDANEERHVHLNVNPLPNTSLLLLEMRDDTNAVRSQQKIDGIIETSFDGLWDWHLGTDYEYMSPKFWEMFGYDAREKRHHPSEWQALIYPEDKQLALELLKAHIASRGKTPYYLEARYKHKDGSTVHVLCKGRVISWGRCGEALRMVGTHTDITEFVQTKLVVAEAKAQKKLNDYLSHELRSPLFSAVSAIGFVRQNLEKNTVGILQKDLCLDVGTVQASLSYIQELVSNTLDLEKCLAGQIKMTESVTDIEKEILVPVQEILSLRTLHVRIEIDCKEVIRCKIDSLRIKQVLMNLASNSLRFTRRGYVKLSAKLHAETSSVRICVEDTGLGIPKEMHNDLFQRWTDLKSEAQGNGMGLHLCKKLLGLMGGTIAIDPSFVPESPHKTGSRFRVTVPLKEAGLHPVKCVEPGVEPLTSTGLEQELCAIVVDDDDLIRRLLVRRLVHVFPKWRFDTAINGEEFLQKASDMHYALVFLDNYMYSSGGLLTGVEITRMFRERHRSDSCQAVVVGVSGNKLRDDFIGAGADLFWNKPIPKDSEVRAALLNALYGSKKVQKMSD